MRLLLGLGLVVMLVMYASSLVGIVTASSERGDRAAEVQALQRDHDALVARQKSLRRTDGVEVEARRLGMVKLGEVPVVVTGLPGDAGR